MRAMSILLEGVDGAGKSSVITHLSAILRAQGAEVTQLQDPGSTELGKAIREWLAVNDHGRDMKLHRMTRFLLYQASRVETEQRLLMPALESSDFVFMDRWLPSTVVYQFMLGNIRAEQVEAIVESTCTYRQFDLAIYLKVDPLTACRRAQGRRRSSSLAITADQLQQSQRLVEAYDEMVEGGWGWQGDHWVTVDGNQEQDSVVSDCFRLISEVYGERLSLLQQT